MKDGDILPIEIMARREDWNYGISIYMRRQTIGGGAIVAAPVEMVKSVVGCILEPMMRLEIQTAQQLIDELWQCGLRPSEGTGSAGSLAATERHLSDMQKITMGLLKKYGG